MDGVLNFIAAGAKLIIAIGLAYAAALWFALIVWTYRDIEQRSRSVITQIFATLLVVLFSVPGAILYLVLRPRDTLDEAFQRSLEEEYLLQDLEDLPRCHSCHRAIESDWIICPTCHTELRHECPNCAHLVRVTWDICPYCATELEPAAAPEEQESSIGKLMANIRSRIGNHQALDGQPGEPVYANAAPQPPQPPQPAQQFYGAQPPQHAPGLPPTPPARPPAPVIPMQRPAEQPTRPQTQVLPVRPTTPAPGDPYEVDLPVDFEEAARREPARANSNGARPPSPAPPHQNGYTGHANGSANGKGNGYGSVPPKQQDAPAANEPVGGPRRPS